MEDTEVVARLDTIIAILKLANRDAIAAARTEILSDRVNREILDRTSKWAGSGSLQTAVAKKSGASTRTVRERIAELADQGLLERRGGGPATEYRSTGVI
jgi:DNA-binding FadR family transcriptional regulator